MQGSDFKAEVLTVFLAEDHLGYLEEPEVHRLLPSTSWSRSGRFLLTDVSGRSALNDPPSSAG